MPNNLQSPAVKIGPDIKTPAENWVYMGKKNLCREHLNGVMMDPAGSHVQKDICEKSGISELWTRIILTPSHQISRRPVTAHRHELDLMMPCVGRLRTKAALSGKPLL